MVTKLTNGEERHVLTGKKYIGFANRLGQMIKQWHVHVGQLGCCYIRETDEKAADGGQSVCTICGGT